MENEPNLDWKRVDLKKLSLQGLIGGIAVYWMAKQQGAPEQVAIATGAVSLATSMYSSTKSVAKRATRATQNLP